MPEVEQQFLPQTLFLFFSSSDFTEGMHVLLCLDSVSEGGWNYETNSNMFLFSSLFSFHQTQERMTPLVGNPFFRCTQLKCILRMLLECPHLLPNSPLLHLASLGTQSLCSLCHIASQICPVGGMFCVSDKKEGTNGKKGADLRPTGVWLEKRSHPSSLPAAGLGVQDDAKRPSPLSEPDVRQLV